MTRDSKLNKRLAALFLLGCVLLNYPILSLVNLDILIFGLPLLYVYIFWHLVPADQPHRPGHVVPFHGTRR